MLLVAIISGYFFIGEAIMDMTVKNLVNSKFLRSILKSSSIQELEYIRAKVFQAVDDVIAAKRQALQTDAEKRQKIIAFRKYLAEQGLTVEDLQANEPSPLAGKKLPPKYRYFDSDGKEHYWSGMGKTPLALKSYLDAGQNLDDFKITW